MGKKKVSLFPSLHKGGFCGEKKKSKLSAFPWLHSLTTMTSISLHLHILNCIQIQIMRDLFCMCQVHLNWFPTSQIKPKQAQPPSWLVKWQTCLISFFGWMVEVEGFRQCIKNTGAVPILLSRSESSHRQTWLPRAGCHFCWLPST